MFCAGSFASLRGPVKVVRVDHDTGGPVIEHLHHLPLIQRQIQILSSFPAVALDGVESFRIKLRRSAEKVGIVDVILNSPCLNFEQDTPCTAAPPERSTSTG